MTDRAGRLLALACAALAIGAVPIPVAATTGHLDAWHLPPTAAPGLTLASPCEPRSPTQFCVVGHRHRVMLGDDQASVPVRDSQAALVDRMSYASRDCRAPGWPSADCAGERKTGAALLALIE